MHTHLSYQLIHCDSTQTSNQNNMTSTCTFIGMYISNIPTHYIFICSNGPIYILFPLLNSLHKWTKILTNLPKFQLDFFEASTLHWSPPQLTELIVLLTIRSHPLTKIFKISTKMPGKKPRANNVGIFMMLLWEFW